MSQYYIYILASKKNGTLYVGMTNNLVRRIWEHKNNLVAGFSQKYHVHNLVYYEAGVDINGVIAREKQLKKLGRKQKLDLINKFNPEWKDLYKEICG